MVPSEPSVFCPSPDIDRHEQVSRSSELPADARFSSAPKLTVVSPSLARSCADNGSTVMVGPILSVSLVITWLVRSLPAKSDIEPSSSTLGSSDESRSSDSTR